MCCDCILLFLPLHLNLYTNIQTQLPFRRVLLTKTDYETNDAPGIVSTESLLNHGNVSAGLYIKRGSFRGSLQRFSSSSLQLSRSIILPFSELMEKEPRHHLVQNCLHSTFAVEQMPIHFLRVSCTEKRNVQKSSLSLSVMFFTRFLPDSLR